MYFAILDRYVETVCSIWLNGISEEFIGSIKCVTIVTTTLDNGMVLSNDAILAILPHKDDE
jgi:hypothetical protein